MKVVILAGGYGTRLLEETILKPKPMVEIGENPILWHIMKIFSTTGLNDFIICLGYKGFMIKDYFAKYFVSNSDITFDISENKLIIHNTYAEPWKITLIDTGLETMTGGRLKRVRQYLNNEPFMLTYGDGIGNIDIQELILFHKKHGKLLTVTAVQPTSQFGELEICTSNEVLSFKEKPQGTGSWINGGYFVCQPDILDYITNDSTIFEKQPLEEIALKGEMMAYKHYGFWKQMDTVNHKLELEKLWNSGKAPWKTW